MQTYISLLRGINVGGKNKIKMAELRAMLEGLGFKDVVTYIQSGNIIFKTKKTKETALEKKIKEGILKTFGLEVPTLVLTEKTLQKLATENTYKDRDIPHNLLFLTFLSTSPTADKIKSVNAIEFPGEEFKVYKNVVYLCLPNGSARSKLSNNFFEKKLAVQATTRNLRTVNKLLEMV